MMPPTTNQPSLKRSWRPLLLRLPCHTFKGRLIVFEGIDGSGKSTQIKLLKRYVENRGYDCLLLSAPSSQMREFWAWKVWHSQPSERHKIDEFGLSVMALGDRLIAQQSSIIPALSSGAIVLCDRYALSVLTYWSTPVHRFVIKQLLAPDLGIYCRVSPDVAVQRLSHRKEEPRELRNFELLKTLAARYDKLLSHYIYKQVDTETASIESAFDVIAALTESLLQNMRNV